MHWNDWIRYAVENQKIFQCNDSVLRQYSVLWITKDSEKVPAYHVLSAICPDHILARLEYNLGLAYYEMGKDFKGFMNHVVKFYEASPLLDNGPLMKLTKSCEMLGPRGRRSKNDKEEIHKDKNINTCKGSTDSSKKRNIPDCFYPLHQAEGILHSLCSCQRGPEHEK